MAKHLKTIAAAYPSTKFVSIRGDMCISNYPDKNIPTLLIYRKGHLLKQVIGMGGDVGLKGMKTSVLGGYTRLSNYYPVGTRAEVVRHLCLFLITFAFLRR